MDCHSAVDFLKTDFLKTCALSMTSLRSLTVALHSEGNFGQPGSAGVSKNLGLITFGCLSKLNLTGHFRNIGNMLNTLFVPKLDTLYLDFRCEDEIIANISPFIYGFLTLNGQHLKDGLRRLSIKSDSKEFSIEGYFDSFKGFTKLHTVRFDTWSFPISASGLANFFHGKKLWSDLTAIHLVGHSDQPNDALSIAALPLLADSFPKLLHLAIGISNPDQAAMKRVTTNPTRTTHNLETLLFCKLPPGWIYSTSSAVSFASFLHQLFPKLKEVISYNHKKWMVEVRGMLKKEQSA